jgi:hypothetical protein
MLLFYSQSRAESNAACLESGGGEINFSVDVRHVLPEKFNNKDAKARRKNFSNHRQMPDADFSAHPFEAISSTDKTSPCQKPDW